MNPLSWLEQIVFVRTPKSRVTELESQFNIHSVVAKC
jgi:hypothetical protein